MTYDHWKTTEPDPGEGFEFPTPSEPNLQDHELYARMQLDAARKNLHDCRERENEAFSAYVDASVAATKAYGRERDAFYAWFDAKTKELTP